MKYLSSQPFSSPASTKAFRDNYPMPEPRKPSLVSWRACASCGALVGSHEATCPACGQLNTRDRRDEGAQPAWMKTPAPGSE